MADERRAIDEQRDMTNMSRGESKKRTTTNGPRSPTAERPESLIEALNDSWRLVEFTDAWRGLGAEDQLSRARKWLAAVPADSPRPEERELREALRWIKERAAPFNKRSMALSMIEDCADAALREGGES